MGISSDEDESIDILESKLKAAELDDGGLEDELTNQGLSGVLEGKDKKSKPRWLVLVRGTLFWYKSHSLTTVKGEVNLKGKTIAAASTPANTILISQGSKVVCTLALGDTESCNTWLEALSSAILLDSGQAPKPNKGVKTLSMTARMNKAMAGKMAVSDAGKAVAKATVSDEVKQMVTAIKSLITVAYDSKTATIVENNILKIFVKYHYLMLEGILEEYSWITMDVALRTAFKWGVKIADNNQCGRIIPPETMVEWINHIKVALRKVEKQMFELLQPYVQAKTLNRITFGFNIIASDPFLKAVLLAPVDHNAESESLIYAMERYLQFSW